MTRLAERGGEPLGGKRMAVDNGVRIDADARTVHRRAVRAEGPRVPAGTVEVEAPPEIPRVVPGNPLLKMLPLVMVVAMVGMVALMVTSGAASNPMTLLFPAMMVVSMLGMFAGGGRGGGPRTAELDESRKDYLTYLDGLRDRVAATVAAQRAGLEWTHPAPSTLWARVGSARMWERTSADDDFVHVRVGVGDQRLATRLVSPETGPPDGLEPVSAAMLRSFVRTHSIVENLPTAISLRAFDVVRVEGHIDRSRALVRAMIAQSVVSHGPDDVVVVVIVPGDPSAGGSAGVAAAEWDWIKWLPHHRHHEARDGVGAARLTYSSVTDALAAMPAVVGGRSAVVPAGGHPERTPHVLMLVDGAADLSEVAVPSAVVACGNLTVLDPRGSITAVDDRVLTLVLDGDRIGARSSVGVEMFGLADGLDTVRAAVLARRLSRYRTPSGPSVDDHGDGDAGAWDRLPGMVDPRVFDPATAWTARSGRARLRVAFGLGSDGRAVELDLKEAAEGGMGPHGLCIGATGSGKSELLRTLVLGLIATHPPDVLNLVLVDFKGGATFLGLDSAPHVAAVITNLSEESQMVERMRDALAGEMNRRQELLRSAGNFANVSDYTRAREGGAALAAMPALFVVVDEFSELLSRFPEFADLFVAIGRLGRSLHIHLLLASQRLDEGRLRGLDSHLSYRIGLKTFSAAESRSVLGVADAYHLTDGPGAGYLKTDSSESVKFSAAYVSGPYRSGEDGRASTRAESVGREAVRIFTAIPVPIENPPVEAPSDTATVDRPAGASQTEDAATVLSSIVDRVRGCGPAAHRVWLPPLDRPVTLDLLDSPVYSPSTLRAAVAVVDRPFDQRRDTLELDLTGASGHVAIVGGPQAGKSTGLATLVLSLAARYSPAHVQFHCLDFGGGSIERLRALPHVGSVATRGEPDTVRRIVAEVAALVRRREESFRTEGIRSMGDVRRHRASSPGSAGVPDIFLVVDGWSTVRGEFEALEPVLQTVVSTGLSYGVHIVVTAGRWAEIRPAVKDAVTSRIELRMGDPSDSDIGRARAATVPSDRPGRGVTREGLHLLLALPRLDGVCSVDDLGAGIDSALSSVAGLWTGVAGAPPVRLLPLRLLREEMLRNVTPTWPPPPSDSFVGAIPVGIDENDLAAVRLDLVDNPHLVVLGDGRCGKTALLRSICRGLVESNTPALLRILLIDYRRTLLGDVPDDRLAGHASTAEQATDMVGELSRYLRARRPGPDTTRAQLAQRSWWSGPEIVVVVDDYDLVVTPHGNPLTELLDLLPQARDVGLHLIVARRCGGAARAMYEPVLSRLRDLASPGIVMSGNRDEGVLLGSVRPSEMPPGRGVLVGRGTATLVQTALPDEQNPDLGVPDEVPDAVPPTGQR